MSYYISSEAKQDGPSSYESPLSDTSVELYTGTPSSVSTNDSASQTSVDLTSGSDTQTSSLESTPPQVLSRTAGIQTSRVMSTMSTGATVPTLARQNARNLGTSYGDDFWTRPPVPASFCSSCGRMLRTTSRCDTNNSIPWPGPFTNAGRPMSPSIPTRTSTFRTPSINGWRRNLTKRYVQRVAVTRRLRLTIVKAPFILGSLFGTPLFFSVRNH